MKSHRKGNKNFLIKQKKRRKILRLSYFRISTNIIYR